jgi:DnaJ-class molecular chaperone
VGLEWDDARELSITGAVPGEHEPGSNKVVPERSGERLAWEAVTIDQTGRAVGERGTGLRFCQLVWDHVFDCAFCAGKGERPPGTTCSVCGGSGKVSVDPPVVVCAFCRGRGKVSRSSNISCTSCKGFGVISVTEPIEVCPFCKGRGRGKGSNLACIHCKGSGVIQARE